MGRPGGAVCENFSVDRRRELQKSPRSIPGAVSMDDDLNAMSKDQLILEVRKLRAGIRQHRDSTKHELCWHHPQLWGLLPERQDPVPVVPEWPEFLRGCLRYRESLDRQVPDAPRTSEPYRDPRDPAAT
jgi:hypothetical protein